ncbi:MAG: FtsQ-type POTRA domain-containing protein [Clostridia bacterium]|nr:FtsQ-type POTRA domain-containing protein [Clostridia bacterium]
MNLEKVNKAEIAKATVEREKPSGVSTFVKKEEKTYVRRYAMTQGRRRVWLENFKPGDEIAIMFPSTRKYKQEEEANDSERRQKAKILIACLVIALVLLLLYPLARFAMSQLVISEVMIEGNSIYTADELLIASGLGLGDRLPMFSTDDAEEKLLSGMPYVKSCSISVKLPNVLTLEVEEERAVVCTELFGEYYALSNDMKVLERADALESFGNLLYIELPFAKRAVVGEKLVFEEGENGNYIRNFLELLSKSELDGRVGKVYFDKKFDIVASVDGKFRVLFGSPSEMDMKIAATAKMIEENADRCGESSIIDVRVVDIAGIVLDAGIDPNVRE